MDSDNQSQQSLSSQKKYGKKVWYPFGSPSYVHHPYSEFCHLTADTRKFALSLATATDIHAEIHDVEAIELEKKRQAEAKKKLIEKFSSLSSLYNKSLNQPYGNDASVACKEKKCQDMIKAVVAARNSFKIENTENQFQYCELSNELIHNEAILASLREKKAQIVMKGDELDMTLQKSKQDLDAVVERNIDLIAERDGFQSKFMHLEYKIQTSIRQNQEASAALYKTLWGDDSLRKETGPETGNTIPDHHNIKEMLHIRQCDEHEQLVLSCPSTTSYNSLARDDIIDYTEKLPNKPTFSRYLTDSIILPSIESGPSLSYYKVHQPSRHRYDMITDKKRKTIRYNASSSAMHVLSAIIPVSSSFLSPLTNSQSRKFKPMLIQSSDHQSMTSFDQSSAWSSSAGSRGQTGKMGGDALDPVFYREKARVAAYRGTKVGEVRQSYDEMHLTASAELSGRHGCNYGHLLTSKHPGLDMTVSMSTKM